MLAAIHFFSSRLKFLDVVPRSRWLSIASGVAVAYVVLHLLPELQHHHAALEEQGEDLGTTFAQDRLVRVRTLLGLVVFYGLEKAARKEASNETANDHAAPVFWLHMGSYGIYNALIGYLLVAAYISHSDSSLPGPALEWALWAGFVLVALSGVFGTYLTWSLETKRRIDDDVTYDRIPTRRAELARDIHAIVATIIE